MTVTTLGELSLSPPIPATSGSRPRHTVGGAFRADIEGLRGVAILSVVAFHCGLPGVTGGFVGVDVFFVLSGYLITSLLVREVDDTSRINLLQFYARRVRRLLPAAALTLIVTLLLGMIVFAPQELAFAARAGRAAAVYLSNVFFAVNATDYFAPRVESNSMLHTWSLAIEEQFYLFWPLLIMVGLQWRRSRTTLVALLIGITAASLFASVWFTSRGGTFGFYELPARAWEFGAGGLTALLPTHLPRLGSRSWTLAGWAGLLTILGSIGLITTGAGFPGWIATIPVVGTCLALVAGAHRPHHGAAAVLGSAPLQWLGRLSYSWYLWHWPVLVFALVLLPTLTPWGKVVAASIALLLASATHHGVENRIRFHPALLRRPAASIVLGLALTLTTLAVATFAFSFARMLEGTPEMNVFSEATADIARMPRATCVTLGESDEVKTCSFGQSPSPTHIVLFGDSHAIQWFDPLEDIATTKGWRLTPVVKSGCAAVDVGDDGIDGLDGTPCARWREQAIRTIVELRPAVVVLSNATNRPQSGSDEYLVRLREGTRRTLLSFADARVPVVIVRDIPRFVFDVPTCLARAQRFFSSSRHACEVPQGAALHADAFSAERQAAQNLANVTFIDATDRLCSEGVCRTEADGRPMYRDDNHLTGRFASSLRPILEGGLSMVVMPGRGSNVGDHGVRSLPDATGSLVRSDGRSASQ